MAAPQLDANLYRLGVSADRMAQLREELDSEKARRDALIVTTRDQGASWHQVARSARLSVTGCVAVVNDAAARAA